jgi:hypothetical protein
MTGFLDVIAGMALGVQPAGAARVSLPSRFARPSRALESGPPQLGEVVEQSERRSVSPQSDRARERSGPEEEQAALEGFITPQHGHDRPRKQPATDVVSSFGEPAAPERLPLPQNVRPRPGPKLPEDAAARAIDARPSAQIDRAESEPLSNRQSVSASALPLLQPRPRLHAEPQQAPLSDAVLAGRSIASRERPSVIQVTIDRIDVRAPPSPAIAKPQRRAQPQTTVSLSDYLREGAKAGRQ